jgi:hypothetical protein
LLVCHSGRRCTLNTSMEHQTVAVAMSGRPHTMQPEAAMAASSSFVAMGRPFSGNVLPLN